MTKQEIWLRLMAAAIPAAAEGLINQKNLGSRVSFEHTIASIAATTADHALRKYIERFPNPTIGKATRAIAVGDTVYSADIEE